MDPKVRTASCAGGCRRELGLLVHHVIIAERPHGWLGDVVWGMRDPTTALLLGSVAALGAPQQRAAPPASASPAPDGGQWTMPAKDYAATRYSALTDITAANVKRLRAVCTFSSGVLGGHEGQPLVVNHTMYAVTPYLNVLYAFDLTRAGYQLKWKYARSVHAAGHVPAVVRPGCGSRAKQLAGGRVDAWRRAGVGVAVLRSGAGPRLLRHGEPGAVQRRAASGRQQVGDQRVGAPSRRRLARVGVSVHAGR